MKIGVMLRSLDEKQGTGVYTNNLIDTMLCIDQDNQYVLLYSEKSNIGRYAHYQNVRERYVPAMHKLLWDQVAVAYVAFKERFDILFNPKFTVPLLAPCRTVTVLHGTEWYVYPQNYPWLDVLYIKLMMPLYHRKADVVIADCDRARKDINLYAGTDPRKVKTIHLAPSKRFSQAPDDHTIKAVKEKYNLPERFIFNAGGIYPGKNIKTVLEAFSKIKNKIPHKLVIAGQLRSKYHDELKPLEEYQLHNDVHLPGWVAREHMPALYKMADLFLFPSMYECCSIALLEAMASGCPIVTSNTGGTPEIAGDAAILLNPNDVEGIADATYNVLTDEQLRQELIRKGLDQSKHFSWEKCARETLAIFASINNGFT